MRRFALVFALLPGAGCVAGYRFTAGPTVDTEGHVGGLVSADLAIGAYQGGGRAIQPHAGLAFGGEAGAFTASPHVGLDYLALEPDGVAWRAGVSGRLHMAFAGRESERSRAGVGLSGAVLPFRLGEGDAFHHLGLAGEALVTGDPAGGTPGAHGFFLFGPAYEASFLTRGQGQD